MKNFMLEKIKKMEKGNKHSFYMVLPDEKGKDQKIKVFDLKLNALFELAVLEGVQEHGEAKIMSVIANYVSERFSLEDFIQKADDIFAEYYEKEVIEQIKENAETLYVETFSVLRNLSDYAEISEKFQNNMLNNNKNKEFMENKTKGK